MLNQRVEDQRDGIEDKDIFKDLIMTFKSLDEIGFTYQNIKDIFTITCLYLHLFILHLISNINNSNEDRSIIKTEKHLNTVLELLGILHEQFNEAIYMLYFSIVAGKKYYKQSYNILKVQCAIHGLIKVYHLHVGALGESVHVSSTVNKYLLLFFSD